MAKKAAKSAPAKADLPKLAIEMWPREKLRPYAANARKHSEQQIKLIAASLQEFGFSVPVLVDDAGLVIAGHGRLEAAAALDLAKVPVIRLRHLSPEQVKAFRIADNQLALRAGWDQPLLASELQALEAADFDLALVGFAEGELDRLLHGDGAREGEDEIPSEVPERTKPGDLWRLGDHRILCGDATKAADIDRPLAGAKPLLMVTDPPYGVNYDPAWRGRVKATGAVTNDHNADWREAWALFPGDTAYVWHSGRHAGDVIDSLEAQHFAVRAQLVWVKERQPIGRGDYHWRHECCFYAVRKGRPSHWQGARDQSTVWEIAPIAGEDERSDHSTQKPVECMRRPMLNSSAKGDGVYDPFLGSGSSLIAAESIGRACYALEIEPRYCDIAIARWEKMTGRTAVRDGESNARPKAKAQPSASHRRQSRKASAQS